jgi:hypothetical protein
MTPPDRSLRRLWAYLDRLDAKRRDLERRVAELERSVPDESGRVPASVAADRLGVAPVTVRRMVEDGALEGLAMRLPDRERLVWVVEVASLERFEQDSVATGARGVTTPSIIGQRTSTKEA